MNSKGFSFFVVLAAIVVGIILLAAVLTIPGQISRSHQASAIDSEITGLNLPFTQISKQCNGGDGVDSGAQCTFRYSGNATAVAQALEKAGYTSDSNGLSSEGGGVMIGTFRGGSPAVMIMLNSYQGITSLGVTRSN